MHFYWVTVYIYFKDDIFDIIEQVEQLLQIEYFNNIAMFS